MILSVHKPTNFFILFFHSMLLMLDALQGLHARMRMHTRASDYMHMHTCIRVHVHTQA